MKKYLVTFAAVLFAAVMTTTVFTSCSKSDDSNDLPTETSYIAMGDLVIGFNGGTAPASWGTAGIGGPIMDYNNAIKGLKSDEQVKQACEKVYDDHQKLEGISIKGTVKVDKMSTGKEQETIWTKTY